MHIYIISQFLKQQKQGEDHFFKLGRELLHRKHEVTLFTSGEAAAIDLGRNRVGLFQLAGLNVIAFNVPFDRAVNSRQKALAGPKFAWLTWRQGLKHPRPDMVFFASPPLTTALASMKLSRFHRVPLVMEVRELWPDSLLQRGELNNRFLVRALRWIEKAAYDRSDRIITGSKEFKEKVSERSGQGFKVDLVEKGSDEKEFVKGYERVFSRIRFQR